MNTVQDYNTYLVNNLINIELIDYFKYIHLKYYNNVDISFMEYFLEICNKEYEFCVNHTKLQEYKVINAGSSSKILDCLNGNNLLENKDYIVITSEVNNRLKNHITIKKEYKLTPSAFKLCLIRAKNTKKYAKYFIITEIVFKYFNDYRIEYKNKILLMKDEKIDQQSEDIKDL